MSLRLKPLAEQTIVITGASSGIGLATALIAARRGARVVIASRNADEIERIAHTIRKRGGRALGVAVDMSHEDAGERLLEAARTAFGGIDTWVNDAGASVYGKLTDIPLADHRHVFENGYWSAVHGSLAAASVLRHTGGAIVNLGSILSERSIVLQGAYCAMKHALRGFTDVLRMELEADGAPVSVTLIKPSAMHTPYPEHARNYTGAPVMLPPPVYDPRLAARAILFAATHPRREITVGGIGRAAVLAAMLLPRVTDHIMEVAGEPVQHGEEGPAPGRYDNLYEPRHDGAIEGSHKRSVRRTSLWLEAQMHPRLATAAISAVSALGAMALSAAGSGMRRR